MYACLEPRRWLSCALWLWLLAVNPPPKRPLLEGMFCWILVSLSRLLYRTGTAYLLGRVQFGKYPLVTLLATLLGLVVWWEGKIAGVRFSIWGHRVVVHRRKLFFWGIDSVWFSKLHWLALYILHPSQWRLLSSGMTHAICGEMNEWWCEMNCILELELLFYNWNWWSTLVMPCY